MNLHWVSHNSTNKYTERDRKRWWVRKEKYSHRFHTAWVRNDVLKTHSGDGINWNKREVTPPPVSVWKRTLRRHAPSSEERRDDLQTCDGAIRVKARNNSTWAGRRHQTQSPNTKSQRKPITLRVKWNAEFRPPLTRGNATELELSSWMLMC